MSWAKPVLLWDHALSGLVATSEDSSYPIANMLIRREGKRYKATTTTTPIRINFDAGVGNTMTADFLFVHGHNFATIGATIALEHSTTGAWGGEEVSVTSKTPADDKAFANFFSSADKRYWSLKITGTLSAPPEIVIAYWGDRSELDYCKVSFDPNSQTIIANVNETAGGIVAGIHEKRRERGVITFDFGLQVAGNSVVTNIENWFENIGMELFGFVWDRTDHNSDVYLMRGDGKKNLPFRKGGAYQQCNMRLKGRVE